jgi:hypothetical protein
MAKRRKNPEENAPSTPDIFDPESQENVSTEETAAFPENSTEVRNVKRVKAPRDVPEPDMKTLWSKAHAHCCHPDCRGKKSLLLRPTEQGDRHAVLGEMSHIIAYKDRGPRGDPAFPETERNRYPNLVLLCPDHHRRIDKQPNATPAVEIRQWKDDWERTATQAIAVTVPLVAPSELQTIADYLMQQIRGGALADCEDIGLPMHVVEKVQENEMSHVVREEITLSLARRKDVSTFITYQEKMIRAYPEKLREGFLMEYNRLRADGYRGDDLYYALRDYASQNNKAYQKIAAAVIILAYYFEMCEIFER